jgi:hypothetical protein
MKQNTPNIIVITTTCSGEIFGPVLSSSKYRTNPAPVGGSEFLSFFAILSPYFILKNF